VYKEEMSYTPKPDSFSDHIGTSPLWTKKGSHYHPMFKKASTRLDFVM